DDRVLDVEGGGVDYESSATAIGRDISRDRDVVQVHRRPVVQEDPRGTVHRDVAADRRVGERRHGEVAGLQAGGGVVGHVPADLAAVHRDDAGAGRLDEVVDATAVEAGVVIANGALGHRHRAAVVVEAAPRAIADDGFVAADDRAGKRERLAVV